MGSMRYELCFIVSVQEEDSASSHSYTEQGLQFSLRMLLSSLKQLLKEQKEGSNDLMLPAKPKLSSGGGGGENQGLIYPKSDNCLI